MPTNMNITFIERFLYIERYRLSVRLVRLRINHATLQRQEATPAMQNICFNHVSFDAGLCLLKSD